MFSELTIYAFCALTVLLLSGGAAYTFLAFRETDLRRMRAKRIKSARELREVSRVLTKRA